MAGGQSRDRIDGQFAIDDLDIETENLIELVQGQGSRDNNCFEVEGTHLVVKNEIPVPFPDEIQIRVRATDSVGLSFEKAIVFQVQSRWQNPVHPLDVDQSESITELDVFLIVNFLNRRDRNLGDLQEDSTPFYLDTVGDGVITPLDALRVINYINLNRIIAEGEKASTHQPNAPQTELFNFWSSYYEFTLSANRKRQ